jgi:hypothetical protein
MHSNATANDTIESVTMILWSGFLRALLISVSTKVTEGGILRRASRDYNAIRGARG